MLALLALVLVVAAALRFARVTAAPTPRPATTMAVLGSGGHTAEMLRLLRALPARRYSPLHIVFAHSDRSSLTKLRESALADKAQTTTVYRAREVGQSYLTSVFTTLRSLADALLVVFRIQPDLLLANGPGICVPLAAAAVLWRAVSGRPCKVVFVESFCRVHTLSLTGRLLYPVADAFVVQWPDLQRRYPRAQLMQFLV